MWSEPFGFQGLAVQVILTIAQTIGAFSSPRGCSRALPRVSPKDLSCLLQPSEEEFRRYQAVTEAAVADGYRELNLAIAASPKLTRALASYGEDPGSALRQTPGAASSGPRAIGVG